MLTAPITATVDGEAYTAERINQDGYTAEYFDRSADGTKRLTISVKHTLPGKNGQVESHLVRADISHYDSAGAYVRTDSVWTVFKTANASQVDASLVSLFGAMNTWLTAGVNAELLRVLNRES